MITIQLASIFTLSCIQLPWLETNSTRSNSIAKGRHRSETLKDAAIFKQGADKTFLRLNGTKHILKNFRHVLGDVD